MNTPRRFIPTILIIFLLILGLLGCVSLLPTTTEYSSTPGRSTTVPGKIASPNPAYENAQATLDYGQSQLSDLSRKSTELSLNMSQAENAAAQSTKDANHRQKIELDYQATAVSMNITQAAATQRFITQQTKIARDATTAAQSSAATATHSAYLMNVTQTAQAQAALDSLAQQTAQAAAALTSYPLTATYSAHELNVSETGQAQMVLYAQATQAAQAIETLTAYPLTATPFAVTQAALLTQQYDREQQSFVNRVVKPLIPILAVLDLVLFIVWVVWAFRRYVPVPRSPRLRIAPVNLNPSPLMFIDGVISDHNPQLHPVIPTELLPANTPRLPVENPVHVVIINAAEPPVADWIAEVEHQLADEGGLRE